jgi:hypothetical protein
VLTHEDLARLLCCSLATIKRDVAALRKAGQAIPTRGQVKDIGKGVSHKAQIVGDYLAGYTFSDIGWRRRHSLSSIQRYVRDFSRVARLTAKGLSVGEIRQAPGLSERLIGDYVSLCQATPPDTPVLQHLLSEPDMATAQPVEIKSGAWLA